MYLRKECVRACAFERVSREKRAAGNHNALLRVWKSARSRCKSAPKLLPSSNETLCKQSSSDRRQDSQLQLLYMYMCDFQS